MGRIQPKGFILSTFEKGWPTWKAHEGTRYTNYGWDPGGATKYGITLRYAKQAGAIDSDGDGVPDLDLDLDNDGDIDEQDIMLIDEPKAMEVYRSWWDKQGYAAIIDQMVATKVMDMSINMGPRRAHILIQRAVNQCGYSLVEDGILGPKSIKAVNDCDPRELLLELCHVQTEHYRAWCDAKPDREVARQGLHHRASWPFVPGGYVKSPEDPRIV